MASNNNKKEKSLDQLLDKSKRNLEKLVPLFCDLVKTPGRPELVHVKCDASTSTIQLGGLGDFKVWFDKISVGSCDTFETYLSIQNVKSIACDFFQPNIQFDLKKKRVIVTSETKSKKSKAEFSISVGDIDLTRPTAPEQEDYVKEDINNLIFIGKYASGVYREILYTNGYFICIPSINFGGLMAVKAKKDYGRDFSIPIELVKVFSNVSKVAPDCSYGLYIDKDSRGLLRIDDFLTIQFRSNEDTIAKFAGRDISKLFNNENDRAFLQFSNTNNLNVILESLEQFKRNSNSEHPGLFLVEVNEEGNKFSTASLVDYKLEYIEIFLNENNLYPGEIFKFSLGDFVTSLFSGVIDVLEKQKVRYFDILSRSGRTQIIMKDEEARYVFIASARSSKFDNYFDDLTLTLKEYVEKR